MNGTGRKDLHENNKTVPCAGQGTVSTSQSKKKATQNQARLCAAQKKREVKCRLPVSALISPRRSMTQKSGVVQLENGEVFHTRLKRNHLQHGGTLLRDREPSPVPRGCVWPTVFCRLEMRFSGLDIS